MTIPVEELRDRLKQALSLSNLRPIDLSVKTGIPKSSISQYMSGHVKPNSERVYKISKVLNVSEAWLMGFDVPMERTESMTTSSEVDIFQYDNIFPITTQKLPMLGEIACGQPIFANEDRESYVEVGTHIKADFCLKAKGDSMINARIYDGDIIFIKKQPSVENGEIAAVIIDDEATLKRVFLQPDKEQLMLVAENTAYAPLVFIGEELNHIHILGKAVAFQGDVK